MFAIQSELTGYNNGTAGDTFIQTNRLIIKDADGNNYPHELSIHTFGRVKTGPTTWKLVEY